MSLAEQQAALARILTDKHIRASKKETNVNDHQDWSQVGTIDSEQIEHQAKALIRKRLGCARHMLPRTIVTIGPQFVTWFTEYAETHPLAGPQRYEADAQRFANLVRERLNLIQTAAIKRDLIDIQLRHGRMRVVFGVFPIAIKASPDDEPTKRVPRRFFIWVRQPFRSQYIVVRLPWWALRKEKPQHANVSSQQSLLS